MRLNYLLPAVLLVVPILTGCDSQTNETAQPARPVTFMTLETSNPSRMTRLTGSVESWKKEMLSCRVAGRVSNVVEPGVDIDGRMLNADGEVQQRGTLLAELDTDRYVLIRDEMAAGVDVDKAQAEQARTELERAIPERIRAARADLERDTREYQRLKTLVESNAVARSDFERSENNYKQSDAALAQALAEQATKTAELAGYQAQIKESEQLLRQAEADLDDCNLYSPFSGQVSKVHAIAGSYLQQGMPVVTVQMMDPVKVELAVSQETDRRLRYNDQLSLYLDQSNEPIEGFVYLKDTVADAATRTFNITVLVRNRRVEAELPEEFDGQQVYRTTDLFNLESEGADGKAPFYSDERSLHQDDKGTFVWKVNELQRADLKQDFDPVFTVSKVYVGQGEGFLPILNLYRGRELSELGDLDPATDLVTGRLPDGVKDGDRVFLSRPEWLMRPGQLVHVELKGESVSPGFYIPRPAILKQDGKHFVFVATDAGSGTEKAKRVEVEVAEIFGDFRRVSALNDGELVEGSKLIIDGSHYLADGDLVNAFDEVEVSL